MLPGWCCSPRRRLLRSSPAPCAPEARRLESDGDGLDRLERQRRAVRLNSWIDRETGMGRWTASWDPETMVRLENRLDTQVQAMFHDRQPDGCPTDLFEKQSYLRAHALLALVDGRGVRLGRPEIVVVVDHTTSATEPVVDWGLPVELPQRVLDDLYETAVVHTVTVRNGVIIDAPGELDLGRIDPTGQPGATPRPRRRLRDLCDPRLPSALQPHQTAPRHLVAPPRPHRPRQPAPGL